MFRIILLTSVCFLALVSCNDTRKSAVPLNNAVVKEPVKTKAMPPDSFFRAALEGDTSVISDFLGKGIDVDAFDSDSRTALMYASYNGNTAIIKMLLAKGASVDLRDLNGRTALMLAASGPFPDAVKVLLDHHADPNLYDREEQFTALMYAAAEGHLENVKILLQYNADPTIKDADGDNAVTFARNNNHGDVVKYLNEINIKK